MVAFFPELNIIKLTEPNTPLNDADHVGSFNFKERIFYGRTQTAPTAYDN